MATAAADFLPDNGISIPAFEQRLTLNTLQAQRVMERVFERAAASLYRIDVILRIIGSEEQAQQVEEMIHGFIDEVSNTLIDAAKQTATVLEANGISDLPSYSAPTETSVRIVSPHVSQFLGLVRKLDKLVMEIDALWISQIVANKERNEAVYRWQQKVIGLGSRIIGIERNARKAAKNQGKGDEIDAQAPISEAELAEGKREDARSKKARAKPTSDEAAAQTESEGAAAPVAPEESQQSGLAATA